ncbi:MAG TPA: hypothetical protein VFV58_39420 [Blastocatellia bacterium]|jgi:hypothetical protein|nr:hypothetical protein [Blastocatellia bacterium]
MKRDRTGMIDDLRTFLRNMVTIHRTIPGADERRFICIEDLVLRHGQEFSWRQNKHPLEPQQCFTRAYRLATRYPHKWVYVEGYAVSPTIPLAIHHAWVQPASAPGIAVELAWRGANAAVPYLGVPIRPEYLRSVYRASGRLRLYNVLDAYWLHHPLVTGKTPVEDVLWRPAR